MLGRLAESLRRGIYTAFGYRAVTVARAQGQTIPAGGTADYHTRWDLDSIRRMSQGYYRDNAVYRGMIDRATDNIIGGGFSLQARTASDAFNADLETRWARFWENPEIRGLHSGLNLERIVMRSIFLDGDVGAILLRGGRVQLVNAERIDTIKRLNGAAGRRVEQGVELDSTGTPLAYHVCDYNDSGTLVKSGGPPIPAKDFLFLGALTDITQTRGVPVCVASFPMLHRINDICDSEAIARQVLAKFAVSITREGGPALGYMESAAKDDSDTDTAVMSDRYTELPEAIIFHGKKGEKVEALPRTAPGPDFENVLVAFLRVAGLPMGLPLELLLLDWSRTNYSSAKASIEQAQRTFRGWQALLRDRFLSPLYRRWLTAQVDQGEIPDRADLNQHEFLAPDFPWIDPLKEAQGWQVRLEAGLSTYTQALKGQNLDFDDTLETRRREIEAALAVAEKINASHPDASVSWREMLTGPTAQTAPQAGSPPETTPNNSPSPGEPQPEAPR